ncbi:hypothetical protein EOD42_19280 [Rhodovarius crocodyli]|uniref:Uncharacterized protein n=1 Tax=Rhodovarius crocodyli TaxID=1979269 RepID=A0A437M2H3_9PROT|nr:hypothetical protein [Rhodovarius crocodyli]RVT91887.1 hypothetical protein EOD42_19280 [Rhodovarius crocodyli]
MALSLPIEVDGTGATATYWRLTHVQADFPACVVEAQLHGYLDHAARQAGKKPLARYNYRFGTAGLFAEGELSIPAIYSAVRTLPDGEAADGSALPSRFAAATDI